MLKVHVAVCKEYGVARLVVAPGKRQGIGGGVGPQLFGLPQDVVAQGVASEEDVLKLIIDKLCRRVVIALYLVANHLHLLVYLSLGILAVEHDVCQQVDGQPDMVTVDGGIEGGVLLVGEGIQLAAHLL